MNPYLLTSIVALAAGPAVMAVAARRPRLSAAIDGFVMVSVAGLIATHILPDAVAVAGLSVLAAAAVGLAAPLVFSRWIGWQRAADNHALLAFAVLALATHAFFDGVALVDGSGHPHADGGAHAALAHGGRMLALSIVLHRLPVGLGLWWIVAPRYGATVAALALLSIAMTTLAGWWTGAAVVAGAPEHLLAVFQAWMAGTLLHVLSGHSHGPAEPADLPGATRRRRVAVAAGGAVGAILVATLSVIGTG